MNDVFRQSIFVSFAKMCCFVVYLRKKELHKYVKSCLLVKLNEFLRVCHLSSIMVYFEMSWKPTKIFRVRIFWTNHGFEFLQEERKKLEKITFDYFYFFEFNYFLWKSCLHKCSIWSLRWMYCKTNVIKHAHDPRRILRKTDVTD